MRVSIAAVICAAGSSSRMGGKKKEFLPLPGAKPLTVLGAALNAFAQSGRIAPIVIVIPPDSENAAIASLPEELRSIEERSRFFFAEGGPTRRASVHNALALLEAYHPTHVLIHDGARPWVSIALIGQIIDAAVSYGAAIPALPLIETPKELDSKITQSSGVRFIRRHLRRADLCTAQTPQGFRFPEILKAHEKAGERETKENVEYTDDAEVWGEFIGQVAVIPGDPENKKITFPEDLTNPELK